MAVVMVEIRPKTPIPPTDINDHHRPTHLIDLDVTEPDDVEVIADMDQYVEHVACSCSAGDDNPY